MDRRPLLLACDDAQLVATYHPAAGSHALLFLQGGGQTRAGAHGSFTQLADLMQAQGFPVLRFDRRGIGDSSGANGGWRDCRTDILVATEALQRADPHIRQISAMGLCDGAAALLCAAHVAGFTSLIQINPWLDAQDDGRAQMLPALVRQRYWHRLGSLHHWGRLLRGQIDWAKLRTGLHALRQGAAHMAVDTSVAAAWTDYRAPRMLLLSQADAIAQACQLWLHSAPPCGGPLEVVTLAGADHSLSRPGNVAAAAAEMARFLRQQAQA